MNDAQNVQQIPSDQVAAVPNAADPLQALDPAATVMPQTTAPTADGTASTAPSPAAGQSPLDALEQILQQAKASKSNPEDEKAQEEARKKEEEAAKFQALKEQQQQEDAQAMAAKIAELQHANEMPQEQARLQQNQAKEAEKQQQEADSDGFEINQLDHTKI